MLVGYARVSTTEQNVDLQMDALRAAKCEEFFTDTISGAKTERPGLDAALRYLRAGDTLVVWKLDRLGRSALHLIQIVNDLERRQVNITFLTDHIDTTTALGRFFFHICASFAELERERIRERTRAGLQAARARGKKGGRPRALRGIDPKKIELAKRLYEENHPDYTVATLCKDFLGGISTKTFYRSIAPQSRQYRGREDSKLSH
jgi:DNA invertase Pin-like site-specific DNA recombinase